jgi:hypothetical protein
MVIRTAALRTVGGYRRAFGPSADYDLWLRISERYRLGAVDGPVLRYRWHASQLSTRNMHTQLLGVVAARHAGQLRRATGADPFDDMDTLSVELLSQLGMDQGRVHSELLLEEAARAAGLVSIGRPHDARVLLDGAVARAGRGVPTSRRSRAQAAIAYARANAAERRFFHAIRWLLVSTALDPRAVGGAVWRVLCRSVGGR